MKKYQFRQNYQFRPNFQFETNSNSGFDQLNYRSVKSRFHGSEKFFKNPFFSKNFAVEKSIFLTRHLLSYLINRLIVFITIEIFKFSVKKISSEFDNLFFKYFFLQNLFISASFEADI